MCLSLSSSSSSSSVRRLRACTALVFTEDRNGPRPLLWAPPNNSKPTIKKQAIRRWERSMSPRRARQARRTRPRKREWGLGRPKCRTTEYQMSKPRRNQTPKKKKSGQGDDLRATKAGERHRSLRRLDRRTDPPLTNGQMAAKRNTRAN